MSELKHIADCLAVLAKAMLAKGLKLPEAEYVIAANAASSVRMTWVKDNAIHDWDRHYSYHNAATFEEGLAKAEAVIDAMPDLAERKRDVFMNALGEVIDLGRKNGIEVDYVNPLVETMKRLSENALTHRRTAAE